MRFLMEANGYESRIERGKQMFSISGIVNGEFKRTFISGTEAKVILESVLKNTPAGLYSSEMKHKLMIEGNIKTSKSGLSYIDASRIQLLQGAELLLRENGLKAIEILEKHELPTEVQDFLRSLNPVDDRLIKDLNISDSDEFIPEVGFVPEVKLDQPEIENTQVQEVVKIIDVVPEYVEVAEEVEVIPALVPELVPNLVVPEPVMIPKLVKLEDLAELEGLVKLEELVEVPSIEEVEEKKVYVKLVEVKIPGEVEAYVEFMEIVKVPEIVKVIPVEEKIVCNDTVVKVQDYLKSLNEKIIKNNLQTSIGDMEKPVTITNNIDPVDDKVSFGVRPQMFRAGNLPTSEFVEDKFTAPEITVNFMNNEETVISPTKQTEPSAFKAMGDSIPVRKIPSFMKNKL